MARRFLITAAFALAFFCRMMAGANAQEDVQQLLLGKWRVDVDKTVAYLKEHSQYDEQKSDFLKEMKSLSVEFKVDGKVLVQREAEEDMNGQWKFVREEDAHAVIQLIREEEATEATCEFLNNDTIALTPQNEETFVFGRVKASKVDGLAAQLVGTWECDRDATLAAEANKAFTQQQIDEMMSQAANMVVTFSADGSFGAITDATGEQKEIQGTWSAAGFDDAKHSFRLTLVADNAPPGLDVHLLDDGKVQFTPDDQPCAVFARKPNRSDKSNR